MTLNLYSGRKSKLDSIITAARFRKVNHVEKQPENIPKYIHVSITFDEYGSKSSLVTIKILFREKFWSRGYLPVKMGEICIYFKKR